MNLSKSLENDLLIAEYMGIKPYVFRNENFPDLYWIYDDNESWNSYDDECWEPDLIQVLQKMQEDVLLVTMHVGIETTVRISFIVPVKNQSFIELTEKGPIADVLYKTIVNYIKIRITNEG